MGRIFYVYGTRGAVVSPDKAPALDKYARVLNRWATATTPSKKLGWKGHGDTWEEYFTSTVPGGASFPQTKGWVGRAGEAGKAGRATLALHRD